MVSPYPQRLNKNNCNIWGLIQLLKIKVLHWPLPWVGLPHSRMIYGMFMFESTANCWNKVNTLIISWQAFADLHAKAASSGLREMLYQQIKWYNLPQTWWSGLSMKVSKSLSWNNQYIYFVSAICSTFKHGFKQR